VSFSRPTPFQSIPANDAAGGDFADECAPGWFADGFASPGKGVAPGGDSGEGFRLSGSHVNGVSFWFHHGVDSWKISGIYSARPLRLFLRDGSSPECCWIISW
jgi:hypothetical protein